MKPVAKILKSAKIGDILQAGRFKWVVVYRDPRGPTIARPVNKITGFELWSTGMFKITVIPGLKKVSK